MSVAENPTTHVEHWRIPDCDLRIKIGPTPYGLGVFATDPIPAGTELGEVLGTIIEDFDYESDYCMDLGDALSLEPDPPYRYVNHSCEPNCQLWEIEIEEDQDENRPVLVLEAIRDIAADDQLTIDYAWPADEAIPCGCESALCRGYIVCRDELEEAHKLHGIPR